MQKFQENVDLSKFSNYKIGGPARFFFNAGNISDIEWAVKEAKDRNLDVFVLGGGTNLLIDDKGFNGLVLKPYFRFIERDGNVVCAGAGVPLAQLLNYLIVDSLSGLEWAGGLPGTFGGAIRGNAGAFGGEIKDNILEVESFDVESGKVLRRKKEECNFSYRTSIYKGKGGGEIILSASLFLKNGDSGKIAGAIQEKMDYRRARHPLEYPNVGSIFKNIDVNFLPEEFRGKFSRVVKVDPFPVVPTACLVSEAGLKGVSFGGAMVSPKHPNFIVNICDASSEDIKKLIRLVKSEVKNKFNVSLEEEVQIL